MKERIVMCLQMNLVEQSTWVNERENCYVFANEFS
jgi:hypothetical protein